MPEPITLASIGYFVGNAVVGFAVNVASSHYHDAHKPWVGYENHDIPRCVETAWKEALNSVFTDYLKSPGIELTEADRMAVKSAMTDLASADVVKEMFLGGTGEEPAWAMDLRTNPLPGLSDRMSRAEAGRRLVEMLRGYANTKPLLSKVPASFYQHCELRLFTALAYFYVEVAIKADDKARSQIMYEIAQGMWTLLHEIRAENQSQSQQITDMRGQIDRIESQVRRSADREFKLAESNERLSETNAQLVQTNAHLTGEASSLRVRLDDVEDAYRQLAQERLREGRTADDIISELQETSYDQLADAIEAELPAATEDARKAIERVVDMHRAVVNLVYPRGEIERAERSLHAWLALAPDDLDATNRLGLLLMLRGQLDEAAAQYNRVLELAARDEERAVALGNLGLIERTRGNLDAAEKDHKQALELYEQLGSKKGRAANLGNLGLIEQTRGNLDASENYHKQSLKIEKQLGSKEGMANQLGNLGLIELTRGNLDAAENYYKQSLKIEQQLGSKKGRAANLGNLGLIERTRGNLDAAENYYKQSLKIEQQLGRKKGMAISLGNLGLIEQDRGNLDEAENYHKQALELNEQLGSKEGRAANLGNLGLIDQDRGNLDAAENYLTQALELNEQLGSKEGMASNLGNLGGIELTRGNLDAAEKDLKQSLELHEQLGSKEGMAANLGNLGWIELTRGKLAEARSLWVRARDLFAEIGMPHMVERVQGLIDDL